MVKQKKDKCSCGSAGAMVFACSGGSNVGQIANSAAIALDQKGIAKFYCLAGVSAHIPGMVKGAESAEYIIAIDGCPVGCAKKALEHLGIKINNYLIVTEKGIKKTYNLKPGRSDVEKILRYLASYSTEQHKIKKGETIGKKVCSCV